MAWEGAAEHSVLVASAKLLIRDLWDLGGQLDHGDAQHQVHTDFAERAQALGMQLDAALVLTERDSYGPAFGLLRTALEHWCVDRLVFLGRRILQVHRNVSEETWRNWCDARARGDDWTKSIADWRRSPSDGRVEVERVGLNSTDGTLQLSIFYFLLSQYSPFVGPPGAQGSVEDGLVPLDVRRAAAQENRGIYNRYLEWSAVKKNLLVNGFETESSLDRLQVHYRFLSAFIHPISDVKRVLHGNNGRFASYDHYASELCLLYINVIACRELRAFREMTEEAPVVRIREWGAVESHLANAERAASHLWFPGQCPHAYDKFKSANEQRFALLTTGGDPSQGLRPDLIPDDNVGYYGDPLQRLVRMHCSAAEMMGFTYISPWHRQDATFR
jgi:hypothetical protein